MLGWLFGGNDREMAATRYAGRESANDRAARKAEAKRTDRVARHHRSSGTRAARQGQAWEDNDRMRERYGKRRR